MMPHRTRVVVVVILFTPLVFLLLYLTRVSKHGVEHLDIHEMVLTEHAATSSSSSSPQSSGGTHPAEHAATSLSSSSPQSSGGTQPAEHAATSSSSSSPQAVPGPQPPETSSSSSPQSAEGIQPSWRPVCTSEKTNFVYIKIHKSASETISAVFRRFGFQRKLSFVLPAGMRNNLGWPWPLDPGMYRPSKTSGYNILCEHSVYSDETYPALMPQDTVFTTSLREPLSHLESSFTYFSFAKVAQIKSDNPLREFLSSPQKWDDMFTSAKAKPRRGGCIPSNVSMVKNAQAFDLGFPTGFPPNRLHRDQTLNSTFVETWLAAIKKRFKFAMITEHLQESMILWRRLMCWSIQDILYHSRNIGGYKRATVAIRDPELVATYREWNRIDFDLYDHYNQTLWNNIAQEGADFWEEVDVFNQIMEKVTSFCKSKTARSGSKLVIGRSKWNEEFSYTESDCTLLKSRLMPRLRQQYASIKQPVKWRKVTGPNC